MTLQLMDVLADVADNFNLLPVQKQRAEIVGYYGMCG